MIYENEEKDNVNVFEEETEYSPVAEENISEEVSIKTQSYIVDEPVLTNKKSGKPTWFGVILIALVFSLVFGAGGGYFGYRLGAMTKTTYVTIEEKIPTTKIGEGVYYDGVIDVVNQVGPAVVSISVESIEMVNDGLRFNPFEGRFESSPEYQRRSVAGSGVIINNPWTDEEGFIITNNHVVEGKQARIIVTLKDQREFKAILVGRDEMSDIAVLKVNAKDLPAADLGVSSELKVGQPVIAIGNPFEFDHTVTTGVVSATERLVRIPYYENAQPSYGGFDPFSGGMQQQQQVSYKTLWGAIQTDAAINPGNSGGPLVTLDGKVIGINSIKREGDNLGFAVSSDIVKRVAEDLIKYGRISWPYIGIKGATMTQGIADIKENDIEFSPGVVVAEVAHGPARDGEILKKDIITKVGDTEVKSMEELLIATRKYYVGDEIDIELVRNGKKLTKKVTLAPYPDTSLN
ncbi:MAG: trypsin-like peptidase domain-containing protein [Caldisericia bacterium]|nr:trypsin-like peptidase domain-containing protein [Caldisericia bacterium]